MEIVGDPKMARFLGNQFERAHQSESQWWTWDYQWIFACWMRHGLCIYPNSSLISNVGCREDATQTRWAGNKFAHVPLEKMDFPLDHPPHVIPYEGADDVFIREVFSQDVPVPERLSDRLGNKLRQTYAATVPEPVGLTLRRLRGKQVDMGADQMRRVNPSNAPSSVVNVSR
jgi:hypothetical protein